MPYPTNGYVIRAKQAQGPSPIRPVIVALNGDPHLDNATVYANPGHAYNWRWVKGLPSVIVLIGAETVSGRSCATSDCEPGQLDVSRHRAQVGWMVPLLRDRSWSR